VSPDLEATIHGAFASIYMRIPSSLSHLLDLSLPPSSSQSSDSSLYISFTETPLHASPDIHNADHQNDSLNCLDVSLTRDPWPLSPLCDLSSPLALSPSAICSVENSAGSVDWPPIESAQLPADENAKRGDGSGVQVSNVSPGLS
jgi:hypothetical protein